MGHHERLRNITKGAYLWQTWVSFNSMAATDTGKALADNAKREWDAWRDENATFDCECARLSVRTMTDMLSLEKYK